MKIVILDGHTINPGDLSWDAIRALGECVIHDRTSPADTVARAAGAETLLTNKVVLARGDIASLPELRYIGVMATGTNVVDLLAARERGIPVTNVPAYSTPSVAQATFGLLLDLAHGISHHARTVQEGRWSRSADWCYWDHPLMELEGRVFGIVGLGRIGERVAAFAHAFGMKVLAHVRSPRPVPECVKLVGLETLLRESDVVSLHCALTPQTHWLMNAERLAWMKPSAFLLNTGRGLLIEEAALAEALNAGRLAGAGLDVLSTEPPAAGNPLLTARNCLITPHLSWGTSAARKRLLDIVAENLAAFLAGKPQNVVN